MPLQNFTQSNKSPTCLGIPPPLAGKDRGKQETKRPTPPTHPHNHIQKARHQPTHTIITKLQSHTTIEIQIKIQIHIQGRGKQ